jgi:hypothetical protein
MAVYRVQGPDGAIHRFEGPDDAKPEDVEAAAAQQFGSKTVPGAPTAGSNSTASNIAGAAQAGAASFLGGIPIIGEPLANAAGAAGILTRQAFTGRNLSDLITGKQPLSMADAYKQAAAGNAAAQAAHPYASIAGTVGGIAEGGLALGGAAKAAEAIPGVTGAAAQLANKALALQKGQAGRNLVRLAAPGAAVAGAESQVKGEGLTPQAALETGLGAVGGVAGGLVAQGVGLLAKSPAIRILARRLNESPDTIVNAMNDFKAKSGRNASIGEVLDMQSRGELQAYGSKNPAYSAEIGQDLQARETQPPQMKTANPDQPLDYTTLLARRNATMDAAMGDSTNPRSLRNQPVADANNAPQTLLADPKVARALRGDNELTGLVNDVLSGQPGQTLKVDDFENLRQSLRKAEGSEQNSIRAAKIGDVADAVERFAYQKQPAYRAALEQYNADSNYAEGFNHGRNGGQLTNVKSPLLRSTLDTPEGASGYKAGAAESQAESNLQQLAPGNAKPPSENIGKEASHAAIGVAKLHSPWGIYHLIQAIPAARASPAVQQQMARSLIDPAQAPRTIALLRANGATEADISRITSGVSSLAGGQASGLATAGRQ